MKFTPRAYQVKAIKFLLQNGYAGLLLDPGLGKTAAVLAAFKILRSQKLVKKALVVAPLRVCYSVWPKEAEKWDEFRNIKIHILHDNGKTLDADADICVINPEGLLWLFTALNGKAWPFDWLIIDESTRFKDTRTQRFKLIKSYIAKFLRRTILTGTPTPNGLLDLFGQIYILDLGASLGRFITHYRNEFFYPAGYGGYEWRPMKDAQERITQRIKPITLSMEAADWLDLPERIDNDIYVDLPPKAMEKYKELEREMLIKLEDKFLIAANAGVVAGKCRQLANGGVYINEHREVAELHEAKVDALEELAESLQGSPMLVAYEFEHDLHRIRRRKFFKDTPAWTGGMTAKKAAELERAWNAGELPILLAQPQSLAHGLNLQESGHTICWFSLIWDYEIYHQFVLRVLRQGQRAKHVMVHHIIAKHTVDEIIRKAVMGKHADQRSLLSALKSLQV